MSSFTFLCSLSISLILLPILLGVSLILLVYRKFIKTIIENKLGKQFGGLLDGSDSVWAIEEESKCIINILMLVETKDDFEEFYSHIKQSINDNIFKQPARFPKLLATFQQAYGYFYLIKNNVTLDDCVRVLEIPTTQKKTDKSKLMELLSEYCSIDIPKKNRSTAFWEVLIGSRRITWNDDKKKCYPIVCRIHHSLGDGVALLRVFKEIFADNSMQTFGLNANFTPKRIATMDRLKIYKNNLCALLSAPTLISSQVLKRPDHNKLHGPTLSGKKIVAVTTEKEFNINIIKKIKDYTKVTFSDVVLTAISTSFRDYFEKSFENVPRALTAVFFLYPESSIYASNLVIGNRFSVAMLNLPINKNIKPYFANTLKMVHEETDRLRNSNEYKVNYWFFRVASNLLPIPILKVITRSTQSTLAISNLPGPSFIAFSGYKIQDLMFWIPNRGTTGVGLSVLSYDGRLQLGISVDKTLMSNETDVQKIIDGIYRNLVLMHREIVDKEEENA